MKPAPPALLERALDMLEHALVIVDSAGELRYRNRLAAALLKAAGPPLRRAIRVACAERRPSALFTARGAQAPLRLVVAPMEDGDAAVWILAPEALRLPDPRVLGPRAETWEQCRSRAAGTGTSARSVGSGVGNRCCVCSLRPCPARDSKAYGRLCPCRAESTGLAGPMAALIARRAPACG
jgi:hypothetical protein